MCRIDDPSLILIPIFYAVCWISNELRSTALSEGVVGIIKPCANQKLYDRQYQRPRG